MEPEEIQKLKEHITSLAERELWALMVEFFLHQQVRAEIVHNPSEHGIDVVAFVPENQDIIGDGYYLLVQAKKGDLSLDKWRKEVLYQLLETPYYPLSHPRFKAVLPRRIFLVVTGNATQQAKESISEFNNHHDIKIELLDINELLLTFDKTGFAKSKLQQILIFGEVDTSGEAIPPEFGSEK
jgi:hypothetical protein